MGGDRFDVVIVLGALSGPALERRARHGAGLVLAGRAPRLLGVGGGPRPEPEADAIAMVARAAGLPDAAILYERESANTRDNALRAVELMRGEGLRRALLVTDWPHMARALACFRLVGVACRPAPVPGSAGKPLFWLREGCACGLYLGYLPRLLRARGGDPGQTRRM